MSESRYPFPLLTIGAACVAALLLFSGCDQKPDIPVPGDDLPRPGRIPAPLSSPISDQRRLLYAQIVEDDDSRKYTESAILEGKVYKSFLKSLVGVNQDDVRKLTNDQIVFDRLMAQPGLYRGQVVTLARGVVIEVSQVTLPPEYELPGYTVLVGVFVDSARDVYAFRILSPPGSVLYDKLVKGIDSDAYPVARLSGYFMKLNARNTHDPKEPPWRRPLLICPEPEFSKLAQPRHEADEMSRSHTDRLLPSERIEAPGAEERLIVELLPGQGTEKWRVRAEGEAFSSESQNREESAPAAAPSKGDDLFLDPDTKSGAKADAKIPGSGMNTFMSRVVTEFKKRLPPSQQPFPAAVVLISLGAPRTPLADVLLTLRAAGVQRLAIKSEK